MQNGEDEEMNAVTERRNGQLAVRWQSPNEERFVLDECLCCQSDSFSAHFEKSQCKLNSHLLLAVMVAECRAHLISSLLEGIALVKTGPTECDSSYARLSTATADQLIIEDRQQLWQKAVLEDNGKKGTGQLNKSCLPADDITDREQ